MADENVQVHEGDEAREQTQETPQAAVVSQESKIVGEDTEDVRPTTVEVREGEVPAQVVQPREADSDVVNVHEVYVQTDEVITDPSDPRAVQIPDAGRGSLDLPIHRLANRRPEDAFADEASESRQVSDEDRARANAEGRRV